VHAARDFEQRALLLVVEAAVSGEQVVLALGACRIERARQLAEQRAGGHAEGAGEGVELFRALSFEEIGTSTLQSRAFAGLANGTFLFALPGSTSACRTAWEKIISAQLDARTKPCNLATLRPRLKE
jgi:hypothetical protein